VFLAGAAWLVFGISGVKGQVDAFQRVPLPQGGLISLSHNGGYVLYYEAPGAATGPLPSFNVTVAPAVPAARATSLRARGRRAQSRMPLTAPQAAPPMNPAPGSQAEPM
jgi:hypothetical protein